MNMSGSAGGALGVCMCSLQVARECGELLSTKVTWGRVVHPLSSFGSREEAVLSGLYRGASDTSGRRRSVRVRPLPAQVLDTPEE